MSNALTTGDYYVRHPAGLTIYNSDVLVYDEAAILEIFYRLASGATSYKWALIDFAHWCNENLGKDSWMNYISGLDMHPRTIKNGLNTRKYFPDPHKRIWPCSFSHYTVVAIATLNDDERAMLLDDAVEYEYSRDILRDAKDAYIAERDGIVIDYEPMFGGYMPVDVGSTLKTVTGRLRRILRVVEDGAVWLPNDLLEGLYDILVVADKQAEFLLTKESW